MGGKTSAEYKRAYYARNKKRYRQLNQSWRDRHPERAAAAVTRAWKRANIKRSADPIKRLRNAMTTRIWKVLKKARTTPDYLGCSYLELRIHLEKQFLPGMTWENYGQWHVDHRIPLASAASAEELVRLCHHSNLQPLWATDNQSKGHRT